MFYDPRKLSCIVGAFEYYHFMLKILWDTTNFYIQSIIYICNNFTLIKNTRHKNGYWINYLTLYQKYSREISPRSKLRDTKTSLYVLDIRILIFDLNFLHTYCKKCLPEMNN